MSNPYEELFNPEKEEQSKQPSPKSFQLPEDDYAEYDVEPLDELLKLAQTFQQKAEGFSKMLSHTKAIDHKVEHQLLSKFIEVDDPHDQGNLLNERAYYEKLEKNFNQIIKPMKELATLHLDMVRQFDLHIDDQYYSIEKEAQEVKRDIKKAIDGVNLQRKILADAAEDLEILTGAMVQTEKRLSNYINAGGPNNISESEVAILARKRASLTNGTKHAFDYSLFKINLLDKAAISLGLFRKETSANYLKKLAAAFINST